MLLIIYMIFPLQVHSHLEEVTSGDDIKSVGPDGSKTAAQTRCLLI